MVILHKSSSLLFSIWIFLQSYVVILINPLVNSVTLRTFNFKIQSIFSGEETNGRNSGDRDFHSEHGKVSVSYSLLIHFSIILIFIRHKVDKSVDREMKNY